MRTYRSILLAVLIGASSIGSSPTSTAQSFAYPENSESLLSRWGDRSPKATPPQVPSSPQLPAPRNASQPFSLKRLIGGENNARSSKLVERIRAFDSRKAFSLAKPQSTDLPQSQQSQQTAWIQPLPRAQNEQSILEVLEQQPKIDPSLPRYQLGAKKTINKIAPHPSAPKVDYSRVAAPRASARIPAPQTQAAPNYRTAAHPISINEALRKKQEQSATQAMLQRQQLQNQGLKQNVNSYQPAATAPPRFAKGSFENEFNKAYATIGNDKVRSASSPKATAPPTARVAQRNSINAIRASHRPNPSSSRDSEFDLLPEDASDSAALELPPLQGLSEVEPGNFQQLELDTRAPNEAASFSPPSSMTFDLPATAAPAPQLQRGPDLLPSLDSASPVAPTEPAEVAPLEPAPVEPREAALAAAEDTDKAIEKFAPVKTSDTWSPPIVPKSPTDHMTPESPSAQPMATVETIQEDVAWWKSRVGQPLNFQNTTQPVDTNGLVLEALRSSPLIKAVSKTPLIRELQVVEADADFDTVTFLDSQFQDRVDPVGNSLTTGGEPFLEDNIWSAEAGIRRRLRNGADFNLSQTLGFQNSNSTFFTPQDQGTATLALNVTQPLLRGRGRYVNQAQILIAQSSGSAAWDTFKIELQEELEGTVAAYWNLYLQRSVFLQKKRNVERGQVMLDRLMGRKGLDSLPAQIARAKSAVLTRRTELANAFRDVRNAETEIRRRVADKNWQASQSVELLPVEMPFAQLSGLELEQVVYTALENRPEIAEAIRRIRVAGVQRDVSANELLPELNLLLGTYVSSLRGDTGIENAFQDQFGQVTPGYSIGLEYELPYRNRAARSRLQQRNLQFRRLQNELENVIQNVIAESQVATRQVSSAFETLKAAREAVVASRADLTQNEKRWESFALIEGDIAEGQSPTVVLDQLLDSQERLSQAENVFAEAEQGLKIAEVALQRIMGTLLMHQQVDFSRSVNRDVPAVHINKANTSNAVQFAPAQPQFTSPQFSQPQFVHQQTALPRVATLQSITPTPTAEEVAHLMKDPNFSEPLPQPQPKSRTWPSFKTRPSAKAWPSPRNRPTPRNRQASKTQQAPAPLGLDYTGEPPLVLPVGYQSGGVVPRFDYGQQAK